VQLDNASQRALLQGLIACLGPGVSIVETDAKPEKATIFPFLAEVLDGRVGYIRLGKLDAAALAQMDSALKNFGEKSVGAVILDLRGVPEEKGLDGGVVFAKRFCPKGAVLFTVQKPNSNQERIVTNDSAPVFGGILVVLVDKDTRGAAEVLAATLRDNVGAMVVGSQTAGAAVEFAEFPLGAGCSVRVAAAQALLPKSGALFPQGISPDIAVSLDRETRDKIFNQASKEGADRVAFDVEPPRMNEAALVANTNPEITEVSRVEASSEFRDTVLQRAIDLVTAIGFYKK
jgi:C-terminal processing protease CtpA/Prc